MHWSLSHMIIDLVQNSIEAGSNRIEFRLEDAPPMMHVAIIDDGRGMSASQQAKALDPFYSEEGKHPGRRIGLGLPFLLHTLEQIGGSYDLKSEPGQGTRLSFSMDMEHIDTPPLEDLAELMVDLMCFDAECDLCIIRRGPGGEYQLSRTELCDALGDVSSIGNRRLVMDLIRDWEQDLNEKAKKGENQ